MSLDDEIREFWSYSTSIFGIKIFKIDKKDVKYQKNIGYVFKNNRVFLSEQATMSFLHTHNKKYLNDDNSLLFNFNKLGSQFLNNIIDSTKQFVVGFLIGVATILLIPTIPFYVFYNWLKKRSLINDIKKYEKILDENFKKKAEAPELSSNIGRVHCDC